MKTAARTILIIFFIFASYQGFSQTPTDQDCLGAIPVCTGYYYQANSYTGSGNYPNEIPTAGSCPGNCMNSGEKNCVWYYITVQSNGTMGFILTPNNSSDDYDWVVYDLTNNRCEDIYSMASQLQVSCNWSGTSGPTGPNGGSGTSCQGASGTPFNAMIPVEEGEIYVINISNYSSTQYGYSLDFGISTAQIYDDVPPVVEEIYDDEVSGCDTDEIGILFSENVRCDRVFPSAFEISGPGGPYEVIDIYGVSCDVGGEWEKEFILTVDPAFASNGNYTLHVNSSFPGIVDACNNAMQDHDVPFTLDLGAPTLNSSGLSIEPATCGMDNGSVTGLQATGQTSLTYIWRNSQGTVVGNAIDLVNVPAEQYTLEVHDLMSCVTYGGPYTVDEFGAPEVDDSNVAITPSNYGASNGSVTGITVSSPFNIDAYIWTDEQSTVVGSELDLIGVPSGYYTLEVIDENTCAALSGPYFVGELGGPLSANPSASPAVVCDGDPATLSPGAGGGSGAYTYSWTSSPAGFTSTLESPVVTPSQTTVYHVQVFDGYITASGDVTVTVHPNPVPDAGEDQTIPHGIYTTLHGSASSGSGDYAYSWTPVEKLEDAAAQDPQTKNLYTTTPFYLSVEDEGTGCVSESPDEVIVEVTGGFLTANPSSYPDSVFCIYEEFWLHANAGGGSGTYSYSWTSEPPLDLPDESSINLTIGEPGEYVFEVWVDDGYNPATGQVTVRIEPLPVVDLGSAVQTYCIYDTVTLDAGNPGSEYLWSNGATTQVITVGTTGLGYDEQQFSVEVINQQGCPESAEVTIIFDYDACVGIGENQETIDIKVFPNPTDGMVNIEIDGTREQLIAKVYNATGTLVASSILAPDDMGRVTEHLSMEGQPAGIYLLRISGKKMQRSFKLLMK